MGLFSMIHDLAGGVSSSEMTAAGVVAIIAIVSVYQAFFTIHYPSSLPRIWERPGKKGFSLKTRWKYYTDCETIYKDVYKNFSEKGKSILVPSYGVRHDIILPCSEVAWAIAQPDNVLSMADAFTEIDQVVHSFGHEKFVADAWQNALVRTEMNSVLENVCAGLNDELGAAFESYFGTDTENWKELDVVETARMIVSRGASRFTIGNSPVGHALCRNDEYIHDCLFVTEGAVRIAGVAGAFPKFLRPLVGWIGGLSVRRRIEKIAQVHVKPLLRERLQILESGNTGGDGSTIPEPQDHFHMMLKFAIKERQEEVNNLDDMARRVCAANFASMHQTSIAAANVLLDILGSKPKYNTVEVLCEEISRVIGSDPSALGAWTKPKVAALVRADSVARETLRLHAFGHRAIIRKVMVDGLTTPEGLKLPKGAIVSFLARPAEADADQFENPAEYDPFRFSRLREAAADSQTDKPGLGRLSFVATSPQSLPFGHGRHSCPGRFIVDFELKMIMAYAFMYYDIEFPPEYNGKRPPNVWMLEVMTPPAGVKIRVKRKSKAQLR